MKILLSLFVIIILTSTSVSQTPQPTVSPLEDTDIVKISTNLIQIDVSVTNSKGKSIDDLTQNDFEIFQNGLKQEITNFSFVSVRDNQENTRKEGNKSKDILDIPVSESINNPKNVRRTIAIVVDDLTMSKESIHYARKALNKFVDEQMADGDLIAIILSSSKIGALQQFTTDKRLLKAAIENVRWNLTGSGEMDPFSRIEATTLEVMRSNGAAISQDMINEEKRRLREMREHIENVYAIRTLKNAGSIIGEMKNLPGRKSMFLLSDGFRLNSKSLYGFQDTSIVLHPVKKLIDFANRSSVTVYTFDPRGLQPATLTAIDNTVNIMRINRSVLQGTNSHGEILPVSNEIENRLRERKDQLFDKQQGLKYLAEGTGGFATIDNNDLNDGIEEALKDQSYYLIAYEPNEEVFDPENKQFNELKVNVKRKDVKVRYRSGFIGVSNEQAASQNIANDIGINEAIVSPFASDDIEFRLNALFSGNSKNEMFLNSYIHINPDDLKFVDKPVGNKEIVFDVLAIVFTAEGELAERLRKTYTVSLEPDNYEKVKKEGLVYSFILPIRKSGEYNLKVALRDALTNKIGSASQFIKVPELKKGNLFLSGVFLENFTYENWKKLQNGESLNSMSTNQPLDTSRRQFQRESVLKYGFEIYNSKKLQNNLRMKTRLFYDGKIAYEGGEVPIDNPENSTTAKAIGAINLASSLKLGSYVLEIVVSQTVENDKDRKTSQFVKFELLDKE